MLHRRRRRQACRGRGERDKDTKKIMSKCQSYSIVQEKPSLHRFLYTCEPFGVVHVTQRFLVSPRPHAILLTLESDGVYIFGRV